MASVGASVSTSTSDNSDPNFRMTVLDSVHDTNVQPNFRMTVLDSVSEGDSRDTDLEQAQLQNISVADRAVNLQTQFGMSVESAQQLAVLADHVQQLTANSQALTDEDRDAVTQSALSIAKISQADVTAAMSKSLQGDNSATEALLQKAAVNLGMQSSDSVRSQLLPALGVSLQ
jgi:hypothetical protein